MISRSIQTTRAARLRLRLLLAGALVAVLGAAALTESWLEDRDAARLTAGESFARLGAARVRYLMQGEGRTGPTVVLLNGLVASLEQWERLQALVATQHPVLAYDRAGLGFSRGSAAHDGEQQAGELADLLAALRIEGPLVVVGFSSSASIARLFAARHPDRVTGLVLLDPYLPEFEVHIAGRPGPFRDYARPMVTGAAKALFGIRRLSVARAERLGTAGHSGTELRVAAALVSFRHSWAAFRELLTVQETARQVLQISDAELPPLIVLAPSNPDGGSNAKESVIRTLVARSRHGALRYLPPGEHGHVLDAPAPSRATADAIDEVADPDRASHLH